jgi:hypothetical protein
MVYSHDRTDSALKMKFPHELHWTQKGRCEGAHVNEMAREPGAGADACNPSYLGGRDQEDHGLKPALANSL